jgi:hypothetical protein
MPENEDNNAGSIITTEVGVGMSSRQLQDILTKALSTLRTDITEQLDSKLHVVTENITVKIREKNYTRRLRNYLPTFVLCEMRRNVRFKKSLQL